MDDLQQSERVYQVGGRSLRVATSPIATSSTSARNRALVVPDEQRLIIKPNFMGRLVGLFFLVLFTAFIIIAAVVIGRWPREPAWQFWLWTAIWGFGILVAVLICLVCLSFVLATNQFRFDEASSEFSHGPIWCRRRRPLSSIVAVQLLRGQVGKPDHRSGLHWPVYELNLVLDDAAVPRLNMSCHGDLAWSHDAGKRLAEFLGVPLLDSVAEASSESGGDLSVQACTGQQTEAPPQRPLGTAPATTADNVETTPLVAGAASFTSRKLVWESTARAVLKPNLPMRLFGGLMAVGGATILITMLVNFEQMVRNSPSIWLVILVGCGVPLVFVLTGLTLYVGRRIRFDAEQGEMAVRTLWSAWRRPLGDIGAIQLISGGYHRFGSPGRHSSPSCKTYQLNLVWGDAARTRFNLANQIDLKWSGQTGHQLARFLKAPFLVGVGDATPKSSGALAADSAPLHAKDSVGLRYTSRIARADHDCLLVRHAVSGCAALLLLAAVVPAGLLSILLWATDAPGEVYGVCVSFAAAPFVLLAALIYFGYHRFDKSTGVMTYGCGFLSITRLLSDIVALQLIPGAASKGRQTYELNLILDDPYEPRLQLARSAEINATREMGRQVAEFLGVRLTER